ncbi:MAG: hypothetical protein ACR2J1_08730 [Methyloceanibacter sp.]|uniref:hypothetical protein n=1 Tax=Methyloceanibacter sp. TaxID=1965321 RepID=UPI003D9BBC04
MHDENDQRRHGPERKQGSACRQRQIRIPDREAEIVERLAIVLAVDDTGNDAVEIDLAAEPFRDVDWLLSAIRAGPNAISAIRIRRMMMMERARIVFSYARPAISASASAASSLPS